MIHNCTADNQYWLTLLINQSDLDDLRSFQTGMLKAIKLVLKGGGTPAHHKNLLSKAFALSFTTSAAIKNYPDVDQGDPGVVAILSFLKDLRTDIMSVLQHFP